MKNVIFINGTMGVGKTTTSIELKKILSKNVFLDADWCWDMNPFIVNYETKNMVAQNITYLLNNFIKCKEYDNIIFCWVMHEQNIIDELVKKLDLSDCKLYVFSLVCSEVELINRINIDIRNGKREEDIIKRSISRLEKYYSIDSIKIDVSNISAIEAAQKIKMIVGK